MSRADHPFVPYANPKSNPGCVRCPRPADAHPEPPAPLIARRDQAAELAILWAATTGSALDAGPIWKFAAGRAHPGGVRLDRSFRREVLEELADAVHYLVWEIAYVLEPRARAGDSVAGDRIPSRLGAIRKVIEIWDDLHQP